VTRSSSSEAERELTRNELARLGYDSDWAAIEARLVVGGYWKYREFHVDTLVAEIAQALRDERERAQTGTWSLRQGLQKVYRLTRSFKRSPV
jgi:hypothetical protein